MSIKPTMQAPDNQPEQAGNDDVAHALSTSALARRRILLKGLGKGSAVIAASIPIRSLATNVYTCGTNGNMCSVSGINSSAHSFTSPGITKVVAGGHGPAYWGRKSGEIPANAWPAPASISTTFYNALGQSPVGGDNTTTLWNVVKAGSIFSSQSQIWVCAYLNSLKYPGAFPYTPAELTALLAKSAPEVTTATAFFRDNLQQKLPLT